MRQKRLRRIVPAMLMVLGAAAFAGAAEQLDGAGAKRVGLLDAPELNAADMAETTGELHIFGITIRLRPKKIKLRQTNTHLNDVHCDIIAQNRMDDMGMDTRNQDGSETNYNDKFVHEIYDGFPDNRHSQPPAGTAGYYFTSYDTENGTKEHMGAYDRPEGSSTYTRYYNDSYDEKVRQDTPITHVPTDVTAQTFVPLRELQPTDLYYW